MGIALGVMICVASAAGMAEAQEAAAPKSVDQGALIPFRGATGKFGYVSERGQIVVKPIFEQAFMFAHGRAVVVVGGKGGLIDRTGKFVVKPTYDFITCAAGDCVGGIPGEDHTVPRGGTSEDVFFSAGRTQENGIKFGVIDGTGKTLIEPISEIPIVFSTDPILIKTAAGWSFIDKSGKTVIPGPFKNALGTHL